MGNADTESSSRTFSAVDNEDEAKVAGEESESRKDLEDEKVRKNLL